jgi:hypothetical protein
MPDYEMVLEMESQKPLMDLDLGFPESAPEKSSNGGKWSILMEEVWFPCFGSHPNLQVHQSEEEARQAFETLKGPRILLDANGIEVTAAAGAPWKKYALRMIRQKLVRKQYALPCHHAGLRNTAEDCEMDEFDFTDFSDNEFCHPDDDFTQSTHAVELPRKALPSDMVSTVGDLGSSRTTNSEFTIATLESGRSADNVPPMPQPTEARSTSRIAGSPGGLSGLADEKSTQSTDSVDICQSTSSSVYRLLDIDSRSGSVTEE